MNQRKFAFYSNYFVKTSKFLIILGKILLKFDIFFIIWSLVNSKLDQNMPKTKTVYIKIQFQFPSPCLNVQSPKINHLEQLFVEKLLLYCEAKFHTSNCHLSFFTTKKANWKKMKIYLYKLCINWDIIFIFFLILHSYLVLHFCSYRFFVIVGRGLFVNCEVGTAYCRQMFQVVITHLTRISS